MRTNQDWTSVWPSAASFKSSVVPLPVRMGSRKNLTKNSSFKAENNLELLKIPNFLHLTPSHIKSHCEAIKSLISISREVISISILEFCTPFPSELIQRSEFIFEYLPVTIHYDDYVHQGTNIRDMRARVVKLSIRLHSLKLDAHAHNK